MTDQEDIFKKFLFQKASIGSDINQIYQEWDEYLSAFNRMRASARNMLFRTVDGVDIFEGDNWWIVKPDWSIWECDAGEGNIPNPEFKGQRFSTKEKAKEFVVSRKPCVSYEEVINTLTGLFSFEDFGIMQREVKALVLSKINQ